MARDYYLVLVRATAALDPNTAEARRAVYDRARLAIMDAGLPAAETSAERVALEAAISRIETEVKQAPTPQAPAPSKPQRRSRAAALAWPAGLALAAMLVVVAVVSWPRGDRRVAPKGMDAPPVESTVAAGALRSASAPGDPNLSYIFKRQLVYYRSIHPAGTVVIAKSQRFLYLVRPDIVALRYTVAIGRECDNAVGLLLVSAKDESAEPTGNKAQSPARLASADAGATRVGARSLALGDTGHRIYGADPPLRAGRDGCLALVNEDLIDLYDRVLVGTRVVLN
jgi:lipoprotein-anchoring transpeptidase ErfK/SrfK